MVDSANSGSLLCGGFSLVLSDTLFMDTAADVAEDTGSAGGVSRFFGKDKTT